MTAQHRILPPSLIPQLITQATSMGIHIVEGKDQGAAAAAALQKFLATQVSRLKGAKFRHSFYIIVHKSHLVSFYPTPFPLSLLPAHPVFIQFKSFARTLPEFITSFFHISTNLYHKSLWLHLQSSRRVSNIMDTPSGAHAQPNAAPLVHPLASLSKRVCHTKDC